MHAPTHPRNRSHHHRIGALAGLGLFLTGTAPASAAARLDFASAGRIETAAGYAPINPLESAEPAQTVEFGPSSGMRLSDPTLSWTTTYRQRLRYRTPNPADTLRPTLYHQASTALAARLSERLNLQIAGSFGAGSLDYTAAALVLSTNTSSLLRASRNAAPAVSTLAASSALSYQLTPRTGLGATLALSDQRPLAGNDSLSQFTSLSESVSHSYAWSLRTSQSTSVSASQIRSRPTGMFAATAPALPDASGKIVYFNYGAQTGFAHQFSARTGGSLGFGISGAQVPGASIRWSPVANAGLTSVRGPEGRQLTLTAGAAVSTFVDTMTGQLRTTGSLSGSASKQLNPWWSAQLAVTGSLPVARRPLQPGDAESTATASASLSRRLKRHGAIEFGIRHTSQMTHPNDPDFELLTTQTWAYLSLSGWVGTDPETSGSWAL